MRCRYLSLSFFALLASLFTAFSITNGDSFAVSDLVYTISSATSNGTYICSSSCSSYKYVLIEYNFSYSTSISTNALLQITVQYSHGSSAVSSRPFTSSSDLFVLSDSSSNFIYYGSNLSSMPISWSATVTLSENNPFSSSTTPSGSLSITQNGTYDVTNYAEAVVNVPPEIIQGDYHNDLQELKHAAILVPAVLLLIYFFWAIYKMIMGGVRR